MDKNNAEERLKNFATKTEDAALALIEKSGAAETGGDAEAFATAASILAPILVQVAHALMHDFGDDDDNAPEGDPLIGGLVN